MRKVKIGLIGAGIAQVHMRIFLMVEGSSSP
jgi:hypothetical protein